MIPTINKSTHDTRQTASVIDHIIIISIIYTFKSGIIKTNISEHFLMFFCYKYNTGKEDAKKEFIYKCNKIRLRDINWSKVRQCKNANDTLTFLTLFIHYMLNVSQ